VIEEVDVSGDVSLLPSDMKEDLRQLGISNLDVKLEWSLSISGDFIEEWARNTHGIIISILNRITDTAERELGSIDL
jgi:hypothetical protein